MEGAGDGGIHAVGIEHVQDGGIGENEAEEWTHPLLLPPVMNTLFENLARKELSQCRLVCREWFSGSLSTWREWSQITLQSQGIWSGGKLITPIREFQEFWNDAFNQCASKPFPDIQFQGWNFSLGNPERNGLLDGELLGHVTYLKLDNCKFSSLDEVRTVMYRACPSLECLAMFACQVADQHYPYTSSPGENQSYTEPSFGEHSKLCSLYLRDCLPDSWLSLLSHFPKLDSLQCYHSSLNLKALEAVKIIRTERPGSLPLKDFEWEGLHDEYGTFLQEADLIRQLNFRLTSIRIYLADVMNHDSIREILKYHSQTLTSISGNGGYSTEANFEFPSGVQFPNVTSMSVAYGFFENCKFLTCVPQVKSLQLLDRERSRTHFRPHYLFAQELDVGMINLRLQKLTRISVDFSMSDENFRRLVTWMPCMEEVHMVLNAEQFRIACENWTRLREIRNTRGNIWSGDMNAVCLDDPEYVFRTPHRYFSQP